METEKKVIRLVKSDTPEDFFWDATNFFNIDSATKLFKKTGDIDWKNSDGNTLLSLAVVPQAHIHSDTFQQKREKQLAFVHYLLSLGADVNYPKEIGKAPLFRCLNGPTGTDPEIFKLLVEQGAEIDGDILRMVVESNDDDSMEYCRQKGYLPENTVK